MKRMLGFLLVWALLAVPFVMAATAAEVSSAQDANQYQPTVTNQTVNVTGGYTYETNLTVESVATWWAGLYGTITEKYVLGTNNYKFYEWPVTSVTGYVYATTAADINWNTASWTTTVTTSDVNTALGGWTPPADENVESTFKLTDNGTYCSVTNAKYTLTDDNAGNAVWPTCIYKETDNNAIILEAKVNQGGTSFKGTTVDYQLLVPAKESTGFSYYIWKG